MKSTTRSPGSWMLQRTVHTLAIVLMAFGSLLAGVLTVHPVSARGPALQLEAPRQVKLGEPINVSLIVQDVSDIAAYEAHLLFDVNAVAFASVTQRQNDLKRLGRDVGSLGTVETPNGVAIGLYSCPVGDCVTRKGSRITRGGRGRVQLATATFVAKQPGVVEVKLDALKFVDIAGKPINVDIGTRSVLVQVDVSAPTFAAPAGGWAFPSAATSAVRPADLTSDGLITHADAMEVALAWVDARERGAPCSSSIDKSRDINGDGCIDVADVQAVVANYSTTALPQAGISGTQSMESAAAPDASTAATAAGTTFVVNSTADAPDASLNGVCATTAGVCTLRAAIAEANAQTGPNTINFNIPGTGVQTIQLTSQLPTINDQTGPLTIDGYTQPGAAPNTDPLASNAVIRIQIVGTGENNFGGLRIVSSGNVVRGLAMYKLTQAIRFYGSGGNDNVVTGSFIGTDAAGAYFATATYPGKSGVHIQAGASRNRVGGTSPAERNVLSGNAHHGVASYDQGTNANVVINNIMGLSPLGDRRVPNRNHGVDINYGSGDNVIGGTAPGERNVVSGNGFEGIEFSHGAVRNKAIGNFIGTDLTGTRATAYSYNVDFGMHIEDVSQDNVVAYNVIGNNRGGGINITSPFTTKNAVYGNRIGISLDGTAIPNGNFGVQINNSANTTTFGPDNIVAYNPVGVRLTGTAGQFNRITRNSIFENTGLGIDIAPLGSVNQNDPGDTDTGPNDMLNFPVLSSATQYEVKGTACITCTVEIFIADSPAGAYGEGKTFVGSGAVRSDGSFTVLVSGVAVGNIVTSTAIDAKGNTSEFSRNIAAVAGTPPTPKIAEDTFSRTVTNGWGNAETGGPYSLTGSASNFAVANNVGTITLPSAGNNRAANLSASGQDVDFTVRAQSDKVATGGGQYVYAVARRVNATTEYRGRARILSNGSVALRISRLVNGTETLMGTETTVSGLQVGANQWLRMRFQVVGTAPTTLRLKVWADGQPEPTNWQVIVTDSTAALQTSGGVGVRAFISGNTTNAPVRISFDDLVVLPFDEPVPTPTAPVPDPTPTSTPTPTNTPEPTPTSTPTPTPGVFLPTVLASDTFNRAVTNGWGSAETGGAYSVTGPAANYAVSDGVGAVVVPAAGNSRFMTLSGVSAQDIDLSFRVQTDRAATGAGQYAYGMARRQNANTYYQGYVRLLEDGTLRLRALRTVNGSEVGLGSVRVPNLTVAPNAMVHLRMQVIGANPTRIQIKAWVDGQAEPSEWMYDVEDSAPELQSAGNVGLRAYVSATATNAPVRFLFDDLRITDVAPAP